MIIEMLKALVIGLVEGITEWLPISSTGHMILVDQFISLDVSSEFLSLFLVVIQIGAICAVIILYFHKLNPFSSTKTHRQKMQTWRLWGLVIIGCIPAAIIGLLLDDFFNEYFYNPWTVAIALIVYGIVFIVIERYNRSREAAYLATSAASLRKIDRAEQKKEPYLPPSNTPREQARSTAQASHAAEIAKTARGKHARLDQKYDEFYEKGVGDREVEVYVGPREDGDLEERSLFKIKTVDDINWKTALKIGCFQMLAIIPGTSRSGSTIIGGMLCGCSRTAAAEFTFFLAIPVMFGWGILKAIKYFLSGLMMTSTEIAVLIT
ncbi:MAG: undecaprenyl-diphosphate phosphatase, partial [Eggerthellaceae bacterium]|nr:undecaprenyl-diphosphate phosphatase [Eggerthellaceae bacterium]